MKKITILIIALLAVGLVAFTNHSGGIYKTNTGNINFYSHTSLEDITADNHKVKTAFDASSGKLQFSVLIKDFEFPKALMQEHFNENYMNSTKYPKSTFSGTIENMEAINLAQNGTYTSPVRGNLTMKDVTKEVTTIATFTVINGVINAKASFNVNPEDYNINIPKVVSKKISREIKVFIDADYKHTH
ncbi:YceI family protein [Bacteroidia bacterium]|nr:YceI family protein [Bacteroidia bacterium]MDB4107773.1 YceI family protein [Bacteroidia bacterium]MDB9883250.1 YceI family protein [Bacteroidia bacterium]